MRQHVVADRIAEREAAGYRLERIRYVGHKELDGVPSPAYGLRWTAPDGSEFYEEFTGPLGYSENARFFIGCIDNAAQMISDASWVALEWPRGRAAAVSDPGDPGLRRELREIITERLRDASGGKLLLIAALLGIKEW